MLHDSGQTVLLTTHYMEEAEALCDRVAVVDHGTILAAGTQEQLKENAGAVTVVTVRFDTDLPPDFTERARLSLLPGVTRVEADGDTLRVHSSEPEGLLGTLVSAATAEGLHVRDAAEVKPSLETVFLTLTGREYRE